MNELNTRRLRTRAIAVSPPVVPPMSSSVPLDKVDTVDRLATDDEESDLIVVNSIRNRSHAKKHVNTELDTDQGEGVIQKLKFAAKQLNDKIHLHTSGKSDKFKELPTTPKYDEPLVNQSVVFPAPPEVTTSFQQGCQRKCSTPYPKIAQRRKLKFTNNKYMKFQKIELFTPPHIHQY